MKKKKHIFLIVIGILFILGLILSIIGLALGANYRNIHFSFSRNKKIVSHAIQNFQMNDNATIQKLDFDLFADDITIKEGENFSITGGTLSKNKVENGTWKVETSHHRNVLRFFGLSLPVFWNVDDDDNGNDDITITLPASCSLTDVNLELSAGSVTIDTLTANKIDISTSAGSTKATVINAADASFDVSAGDIQISQFNITNSAKLDCSAGDIKLGTKDNATQNVCNNLNADCSVGALDVYGKLTGSSKLDVSMGDIDLGLAGSKNNYNFHSTSTTLGDINYKNEGTSTDNNTYGDLSLDCTMGEVTVSFF